MSPLRSKPGELLKIFSERLTKAKRLRFETERLEKEARLEDLHVFKITKAKETKEERLSATGIGMPLGG